MRRRRAGGPRSGGSAHVATHAAFASGAWLRDAALTLCLCRCQAGAAHTTDIWVARFGGGTSGAREPARGAVGTRSARPALGRLLLRLHLEERARSLLLIRTVSPRLGLRPHPRLIPSQRPHRPAPWTRARSFGHTRFPPIALLRVHCTCCYSNVLPSGEFPPPMKQGVPRAGDRPTGSWASLAQMPAASWGHRLGSWWECRFRGPAIGTWSHRQPGLRGGWRAEGRGQRAGTRLRGQQRTEGRGQEPQAR